MRVPPIQTPQVWGPGARLAAQAVTPWGGAALCRGAAIARPPPVPCLRRQPAAGSPPARTMLYSLLPVTGSGLRLSATLSPSARACQSADAHCRQISSLMLDWTPLLCLILPPPHRAQTQVLRFRGFPRVDMF